MNYRKIQAPALAALISMALFNSSVYAFEPKLDMDNIYFEAGGGSVTYNAPSGVDLDYDDAESVSLTAGVHFANNYFRAHYISLEGSYNYFGAGEDVSELSIDDIEAESLGLGLKLARAVFDDSHLYIRFGAHSWNLDASSLERATGIIGKASVDGVDAYGGIGFSAKLYQRAVVKLEATSYTFGLDGGADMDIYSIILGAGFYFK